MFFVFEKAIYESVHILAIQNKIIYESSQVMFFLLKS